MIKVLEPIDSANPSEVLKYLDFIGENCYIEAGNAEEDCILYAKDYFGFNTIKEALLKEQEHEKVLEIIKLKRVSIPVIFEFDTYDDYWEWAYSNVIRLYLLSREEFNLLKKVFCNE